MSTDRYVGCIGPDGLVRSHLDWETCDVCQGTTNDDSPFQIGELVEWYGDVGRVVSNYGQGGDVEFFDGASTSWRWQFDRETAVRRATAVQVEAYKSGESRTNA